MDTLPYDDIDQLIQVLIATFAGDNQSVKKATDIIMAMANEPIRFVDALVRIMLLEKTEDEILKAKNAASVALSKCTLELIKEKKINSEHVNYIIDCVIKLMFCEFISLPMKVNLQYFLILLYAVDIESKKIIEGLNLVREKLGSPNVGHYPGAFLVLQAIINTALIPQEDLATWFLQLKDQLLNVGGALIGSIMQDAQDVAAGSEDKSKMTNIFVGLKIFKMWVLTIHEFIKLLGHNNMSTNKNSAQLKVVVSQELLVQILLGAITVHIATEKQIKDCMYSTSGLQEIDQLINNVKTSTLKSFNKIIDMMKELNEFVEIAENKFFLAAQAYLVPSVMTSIAIFFKHDNLNLDAVLKDRDLYECIVESIAFLTRMLSYQELHPMFTAFVKPLVVDVCFPLLKTSKSELENFEDNPEQFVSLSVELCSTRTSMVPKIQAAKLLEKLAISIDGALSYIAMAALQIIDYSMVLDKKEELGNSYKDLAEHANSIFISKLDPMTRVEACLSVLSLLNTAISKRKDLIANVEKVLATYQKFFLGPNSSPLVKSRVCLLISSYAHSIFKGENQKEIFAEHLRFLLECSGLQGPDGLVEQANHSLYIMFEREFLAPRLTEYVCDFLEVLTTYIIYTNALKTFDIIHEIVVSYELQVLQKPELLINVTKALVKRADKEFELAKNDSKSKKIVLNKVWNVIRGIGGKEDYIEPFQAEIEEILSPLFAYLETNMDTDFNEDILNYVASVTGITKKVSPLVWKVFQTLPRMFEKAQGVLVHIFPPLNMIIVYGHQTINGDSTAIQILINMGIQALRPTSKTADEANSSEGAVLLQIILQYIDPIAPEQFEKILMASYDRLKYAKMDYLKARLGGVFLCSFIKNFEITQFILSKSNILTDLMDLFLKNVFIFETHPYDRKVLLMGLSSMLGQNNVSDEIKSRYPEIFDITISLLQYVRFMEQYTAKTTILPFGDDSSDEEEKKASNENLLKKFLGNQPAPTIDDDDDEDMEPDDEDGDDDDNGNDDYIFGKSEANAVVKNLATELKQKDEYGYFKDAVIKMRELDTNMLMALVQNLPEKKRDFLKDVLQSQRVATNLEGKTEARKIVKPGAKKIAQVQMPNSNAANS